MKNLVVLTGAGISAESGLKTFRDSGGLWEGHDVTEVASPQGFARNPQLVLQFYNDRRKQLKSVNPNLAHLTLAELESCLNVSIITQNIDNLHERAGSSNVLHLHGELLKARSCGDENDIFPWHDDITLNNKCSKGYQIRPHIVWFGESVPLFEDAMRICETADVFAIIGTSMQVYPAASLIHYAPSGIPIFFIDPKPNIGSQKNLHVIAQTASTGTQQLKELLQEYL
ncbi:SIR2 family NAD-dependent protein deacylase [Aegicerativicinus sediminis]|uniref:SIR2 family NAD-dependent protein deacylase n=1 Tax=Aegicerativicinus sediminis TaxID=2893202 RepID=UPI001E3B3F5B|nr:NAD-dependent deacylase [Aegicerativicinus sediminis]